MGKKSIVNRVKRAAGKVNKAYKVTKAGATVASRMINPAKQIRMLNRARKGKGLVLPGSKYIGPGNPINSGKPVNKDDALARQHDIDYDNYLKKGVKSKDLYLGYSDADKRLLRKADATTPEGFATTVGMGAKKLLNKTGLTKRIRDKDVYKK